MTIFFLTRLLKIVLNSYIKVKISIIFINNQKYTSQFVDIVSYKLVTILNYLFNNLIIIVIIKTIEYFK